MVDLEPFLAAPFEEASNRSFKALLVLGVTLLSAVALFGRSPVTTVVVAGYLCLVPTYVGYRIHVWDGDEGADDGGSAETDGTDDCAGS